MHLSNFIIAQGFTKSKADAGVYFKGAGDNKIIISVYVDDILIFGGDRATSDILTLKEKLNNQYSLDDLGMVKNILGMQIERDNDNNLLHLSQNKYINKQVKKFRVPTIPQQRKAVPITKLAYADVVHAQSKRAQFYVRVQTLLSAHLHLTTRTQKSCIGMHF